MQQLQPCGEVSAWKSEVPASRLPDLDVGGLGIRSFPTNQVFLSAPWFEG
jgi:hypothetical protein